MDTTTASAQAKAVYLVFGLAPVLLGLYSWVQLYTNPATLAQVRALVPPGLPNYIQMAVPWFFVLIAIELGISVYKGKKVYRFNDSISSIFMGTSQQLFGAISKGLSIFPYAWISYHYKITPWNDNTWALWLFTFLFLDMMYYWFHRFAHEWNPMWAGHVVHHSSQEYNLSTALRQGLWQPFTSWVFYLPLAFFVPVPLYSFHSQWNTLYQFWIHTRLFDRFPWIIEFIFNTPSHHRVHHGRNPQYIDKNYAGTLIIWDRMFGTFEPEEQEVVYGITHDLGTWSPFYLQFHQWEEMWQTAHKTEGLWNKVRVFLDFGPGHNYCTLYPELVKNPPPEPTLENQKKHDNTVPTWTLTIYAVVQAVFCILTILVFQNLCDAVPFMWRVILVAIFFFGLNTISALFDNKWWAPLGELTRIVIFYIIAIAHFAPPRGPFNLQHIQDTVKNTAWKSPLGYHLAFSLTSAAVLLIAYSPFINKRVFGRRVVPQSKKAQ